jgi:hypothetical protein
MNAFKGIAITLLLVPALARAEALDGYISPLFSYSGHLSSTESGSRIGTRIEFGRLSRNIALDLRVAQGLDYTDLGATLRFFKHWAFTQSFGLSMGSGFGALYSDKHPTKLNTAGNPAKFVDYIVNPFARFLYDSDNGWGASAELGLDIIPRRSFTTELQDGSNRADSTLRNRIVFALGFVIDV